MSNHVNLAGGTQTVLNSRVRSLVSQLQQAKEEAAALKGIMGEIRAGTPTDNAALATELGLASADDAANVYSLLCNIQLAADCMNSADMAYFLTRLG
jgi:hypothetical protein